MVTNPSSIFNLSYNLLKSLLWSKRNYINCKCKSWLSNKITATDLKALQSGRYHNTQAPGTPDMKYIMARNQILTPRRCIPVRPNQIKITHSLAIRRNQYSLSPLIHAVVTAIIFQKSVKESPDHQTKYIISSIHG